MPTYDRKCYDCGKQWETEEPMDAAKAPPDASTCPRCGSKRTGRLLSAVPAILQGRGWAKDGYSS